MAGQVDSARLLSGSGVRKMRWMSYAGFLQDDWRVTPKVTLNLGLRYEYKAPIKEVNSLWANFDPTSATGLVQQGTGSSLWKPDRKGIGPRVGLAWDVTGKGTTVVRAGGSVIYSTLVAVYFMSQPGIQNTGSTSLSANPTAANFINGATTTPGTGTIDLTTSTTKGNGVAGSNCWDACTGQTTLFPTSALCGGAKPTCSDINPCNIM